MKMSEVQYRASEHLMVHGDPKTGKSQLVSELALPSEINPDGFKLIWVSMDGGHTILDKLPPDIQEKNIELVIIPDTKEFPIAIGTCLKILSGGPVEICYLHGQVSCSTCKRNNDLRVTKIHMNQVGLDTILVFDHMKQLAQSTMAWVILDAIKNDSKDATGTKEKDPDMFKPAYDQYAIQGNLMNKVLGNIQVAPYNVACISHSAETKMEDGSKKLVPLVGSDPYSRNSGGFFDHVIYCSLLNKSHKFGSASTYMQGVLTGSRKDVELEKLGPKPSLAAFFAGKSKRDMPTDSFQARTTLKEVKDEVARQDTAEVVTSVVSTTSGPAVVAGQPVNGDTPVPSAKRALLDKLKALKDTVKE